MTCKCFCNNCKKEVGRKYWDGMIYLHMGGLKYPDGCYTFHLCDSCRKIYVKKGWKEMWGDKDEV